MYPLAVIVHGTERRAEGFRDAFRDFAEDHQCVVLAPLFPCGIGLHPERLRAVSIGAPGIVTLLDTSWDWWVGVGNFEDTFKKRLDIEAIRNVAVQMVIGSEDIETWEITLKPGDAHWMPGADVQGVNRLERMEALKRSLQANGVGVRHDVVPGVGHDGFKMIPAVESFFGDELQGWRPAPRS